MINLITDLISFTQPTNLDRESLTVIESIAKIQKVVNECITQFNNLEEKTEEDYKNFLNQIKEYKEYCKELIQSYYNNVDATIEEFKHLIDLLNGIDELVRYVEAQSKFVQDLAKQNQDAIDKGTIATKDDINKINTSLENKASKIFITPEDFGAKGDGVTDDYQPIMDCLNYALNNNYDFVGNNKYYIGQKIVLDCTNNKNINITFNKEVKFEGDGIELKNSSATLNIILKNGGNANSIGVNLINNNKAIINIKAQAYGGTVLKNGGNNQDGTSNHGMKINLLCNGGCYRALIHGDDNSEKYQDWFGCYETIYDMDSMEGSIIQYSRDITIKHYENHFYDTTHTKKGLIFTKSHAHIENLAVGGIGLEMVEIDRSTVDIVKLYTIGEETSVEDRNTIGLKICNPSYLFINFHRDLDSKVAVDIDNGKGGWNVIKQIITNSSNTITVQKNNFSLGYGTFASYSNINNFDEGKKLLPLNDTINNYLIFPNLTNYGLKHYSIGENLADKSFRLGLYNDSGSYVGSAIRLDTGGDITFGISDKKVGFFGHYGNTKQTAKTDATDLNSCIELINNLKDILKSYGLIS